MKRTLQSQPSRAADAYKVQRQRVIDLLNQFQDKLADHARRQEADPRNWGFVGDLEHYAAQLEDLLGIEYRADVDMENREVCVTRRHDGKTLVYTFDDISRLGGRAFGCSRAAKAIELAKGAAGSSWG